MFIVTLMLLLIPGLISTRILWQNKSINRENYVFIAVDYLTYSFLILIAVYTVMFLSYPERSVSLSAQIPAVSNILSASFVFKYSITALASAVILPALVPRLCKFYLNLEDNRAKKKQNSKK